jgi:hypothetical protein
MDDLFSVERAWWSSTLTVFFQQNIQTIVERLAFRTVEKHRVNHEQQLRAWLQQIEILRQALAPLPGDWRLLLEYPLLRLGRRLDAVLVSDRAIFVIEFKIGATSFEQAAKMQVEDYALDLQDFHAASKNIPLIPVLVASDAVVGTTIWPFFLEGVCTQVFEASGTSLGLLLQELIGRIAHRSVDVAGWEHAPYRPVPTIVEAAEMLYAKHGVEDIRNARADIGNLTRTTDVILGVIRHAEREQRHMIVFVTGIPGAGKTLCGLNAVFGAETGAAFLTGNLPLVHVLREALARDAARNGASMRQARQKTESAVQGLTGFVRDNVDRASPPHEHVVVFDEAQRAWDAAYGARKFGLNDSEAALFLDILRKHQDYAVVIALVGNGQEINTGEAGLGEWGRALTVRPDWHIWAAPDVLTTTDPRQRLFAAGSDRVVVDPALHLDVAVRQIRSTAAAPWVDAVLRGDRTEAMGHAGASVPFYVTRSLQDMRAGLRARARGKRRAGLVCSTGARRLVADGIWPDFPHLDSDAIANWFLNSWPDVRASDALEIPATQFACQGLELDYVGLCWGGDLLWQGGWRVRRFVGKRWQNPAGQDARDFRLNTYRVLLTRARYDTVIWVPRGDLTDATRDPEALDATAAFLLECGATPLPDFVGEAEEKEALLF